MQLISPANMRMNIISALSSIIQFDRAMVSKETQSLNNGMFFETISYVGLKTQKHAFKSFSARRPFMWAIRFSTNTVVNLKIPLYQFH